MKHKFLTKQGKTIIELNNFFKIKNKFAEPNYKNFNSKEPSYQRNIKTYSGVMTYRIKPLVKSGAKIFKVIKNKKVIGYTLAYHQEEGMIEAKTIPGIVKIAFDSTNKELKLIGRDAIGEWIAQITPLYEKNRELIFTKNGKTMSERYITKKGQKNK